MGLIVQKYGGTSVSDIDHIKSVARRVLEMQRQGNDMVVVLSAMAGETDRLIGGDLGGWRVHGWCSGTLPATAKRRRRGQETLAERAASLRLQDIPGPRPPQASTRRGRETRAERRVVA